MGRDLPPRADGPDNRKTLRATVIGAVERKQALDAAGPAPTVIGPVVARVGSLQSPATPAADLPAPERKSVSPTAIPGIAPERVAVTLADLRALSPGTPAPVVAEALRLVQMVVPSTLSDRRAVMWGHQLQQDYTDLVSRTLDLTQSDLLRNVSAHLGRMIDILGSIDIEAACGAQPASGMFGSLFKGVNNRIDTPAELARARTELDQLVRLMNDAFGAILGFKETLEQHASRIDAIGDAVEATALAALSLAAHLAPTAPKMSKRFTERSMSLTQTVAQIRSGTTLRSAQLEQPLEIIATVQNVALVMVPGWLGSIAAISTLTDSRRQPTPTEARELANQLRNILQQFNA